MRALLRAAGPSALSAAAPPSFGARGSGLVVAALLLLLELGRTGLAGGAASSGGNVQGASGTNTTDCCKAIGAGAEAEELLSSAHCAGEGARLALGTSAWSAVEGAPAWGCATWAEGSGESRLTTLVMVCGR